MRYLKAVFIATLLAMGMVNATWYWSPLSYVLPLGDSARTACTNARCIVGTGSVIHVVFARNKKIGEESFLKVYYSRSTDLGFTWTAPFLLSDLESYDSRSPSIGMWDHNNLLVIWNDGNAGDLGISVQSQLSTDGGQNWWVNPRQVNTNASFTCSNPALSCETCETSSEWVANAVWREVATGSTVQRIAHRAGKFDDGVFGWLNDEENIIPNAMDRKVDYPSVWSNDAFVHTAEVECEVQGGIYSSDTLLYDANEFPGTDWPAMSALDGGAEVLRCGHPSIMCDGYREIVAYERGLQQPPRGERIRIAGRFWHGGNPDPWQLLSEPILPSWADSCEFPQLFPIYYMIMSLAHHESLPGPSRRQEVVCRIALPLAVGG
jgi:hypothetical protein